MVIFPQCLDCKNYIGPSEKKGIYICKAFPDGIPRDVFWNRVYHTDNIPGDHGILYEDKRKRDQAKDRE